MTEREQILTYLRKRLAKLREDPPPVTGGIPSPRHHMYWTERDTLSEVIRDIEQEKHHVDG